MPAKCDMYGSEIMTNMQPSGTSKSANKFWGVWLPVPTFLGIIVVILWNYFILATVGYTEKPLEKAAEKIIEEF